MKYVILSDSDNIEPFVNPRQLTKINGETLVERTIRLLKENGAKDVIITSHDKRFDNLGAIRYEPLYNDYKPKESKGYWLSAFPIELLNQPITFLFGDVYYSENAIKKIVEAKPKDNLFFCTYNNNDKRYIKHHDEPLAYKVIKPNVFKAHIEQVKRLKDEGLCCREPIVWELYRSLNGQDINTHIMTSNYVAINDESCDIDSVSDIILLEEKLGGDNMIKCEVIKEFTLAKFDELKNIQRRSISTKGKLYVGDTFECDKTMADYLLGDNKDKHVVVKVLEVIPEERASVELEVTFDTKKAIDKVNDIKDNGGTIEEAEEEVKKIIDETIKVKPKKKKTSKK